MDPLTIGALISAGVGAASGIGRAIGRGRATRDLRQRNEQELGKLQQLERTGQLGLTQTQRNDLNTALVSPMQQAAATSRERAERIGASASEAGFGAREAAQLRQEQSRQTGEAEQQARATISQIDQQTAEQQRQEIESRLHAQTLEQLNQLEANMQAMDSLAQAAGPLAGAVSQQQIGRSFANQFDVGKLAPEEMNRFIELVQQLPEEQRRAAFAVLGR